MNRYAKEAARLLGRLRERKPLVHHITNFAVISDTASVTLHVSALPVMAHARFGVAFFDERHPLTSEQSSRAHAFPNPLDGLGRGSVHVGSGR